MTERTERLHVAAAVVAAKGVLLDMVNLKTLVEKLAATHAAPLLRGRHLDLLRLCQLAAKLTLCNEIQPQLPRRATRQDATDRLDLKVHLPLIGSQSDRFKKERQGGHPHAIALDHCT